MPKKTKKTKTIGEHIDALVKRYGSYGLGIYILEQAFRRACTGDDVKEHQTVLVGGKLSCEWPRVQRIKAEEEAILHRLRSEGVI